MCPVTLDYKVFDTTTCATLCFGTNITINPVSSYAIPGSCITGAEDIEIILSTPSSVPVNYGFGVGGGGAWSCYNGGNPATVTDSGTGGCFGTGGWTILVSFSNAAIW